MSEATFYNWKAKYGGMQVSEVKRLKDLEEENRRLKNGAARADVCRTESATRNHQGGPAKKVTVRRCGRACRATGVGQMDDR